MPAPRCAPTSACAESCSFVLCLSGAGARGRPSRAEHELAARGRGRHILRRRRSSRRPPQRWRWSARTLAKMEGMAPDVEDVGARELVAGPRWPKEVRRQRRVLRRPRHAAEACGQLQLHQRHRVGQPPGEATKRQWGAAARRGTCTSSRTPRTSCSRGNADTTSDGGEWRPWAFGSQITVVSFIK